MKFIYLLFLLTTVKAQDFCSCPCKPICHQPIDVGFLLDRSGSIPKKAIDQQKDFSKELVDNFYTNTTDTNITSRFSFIQFNKKIQPLLDYSNDKNKILQAIDSIKDSKGWTNTRGAVEYFTNNILPHARHHVTKFLILITDGVPVLGKSGNRRKKFQKQYTIDEVGRMKHLYPDIYLISIGIGNFNKDFLEQISDKHYGQSLFYDIENYSQLKKIITNLTNTLCNFI